MYLDSETSVRYSTGLRFLGRHSPIDDRLMALQNDERALGNAAPWRWSRPFFCVRKINDGPLKFSLRDHRSNATSTFLYDLGNTAMIIKRQRKSKSGRATKEA